jgi:S-adenosylmethionine:tRNA ribosyltransferase-isomerase
LKQAQEMGYAERDPQADVEGYDACRKIAILSSLAFGKTVDYEQIPTEGITKITLDDLKVAKALGRKINKIKDGDVLEIAPDFCVQVEKKLEDGFLLLKFLDDDYLEKIEKYGCVPLPPYIKNNAKNLDPFYQTIYANNGLAVAAPTAGLHFTKEMLAALEKKRVKKVFITLNVGAGTFLPVRSDNILDHKMHEESFTISSEAAQIINEAKAQNKKIIAVGTTSLRALESAVEDGLVKAKTTTTEIFIYPPYDFKIVDILMTNFHLPKSTLFMLICAFVGRENAFKIYEHAIEQHYRFYSYGDASLLIP